MRPVRVAALGAGILPIATANLLRRDLTPPKTPQNGWEYIGCFIDSVEERALDLARHYDTEALTGQSCVEWCADNGFTYAGTEYKAECFCGNTRPASAADEEDCNMACTGDEDQPCGGSNRLNVYTSDVMAPAVADWAYSGCYEDSVAKRVLTGDYHADPAEMTPEVCIDYCKNGGFEYAGVEYGAECFCGNTLPPKKEEDGDCKMPCPGDTDRTCGAGNRLQLYASNADAPPDPDAPPEIEGWLYAGCVKEGNGGRTLTHQVWLPGGASTMTNERCVAACDAQGYHYAGTEYAGECFCGNEYENEGGELTDEGCNMKCLGDRTQFCGGPNRLSAWSINELPPPSTETSTADTSTATSTTEVETETSTTEVETETSTTEVETSTTEVETSTTEVETSTTEVETETSTTAVETETSTTEVETETSTTEVETETSTTEVETSTTAVETETSTTEVETETSTTEVETSTTEVETSTTEVETSTTEVETSTTEVETETSTAETDTATLTESETEVSTTASETSTSAPSATGGLPEGWAYKGCYIDPPGRAMNGVPGSPSNDMTPEKCIGICIGLGYTVAGVEYAEECFCGNALNNGASKTSESDCNMACKGDNTQMCGAGNRLSIYSKGDFPVWPVPKVQKDDLPGDWEYKGCVFDNANPYILEWLWEDAPNYASSKMTIPICLERCQKFGYSAAGVEYGRQCVCGDLGKVEERGDVWKDDGFCSMPCPGDRDHTCGAGNHINYYEWAGEPLNTFHYASGPEAGRYEHFSTSPIVPLISSVGINDKVIFVEKHGTSLDNTEGSFEFDYSTNTYRELALKTDVFCSASFTLPDKAGRMINIGGWSAESVYGIRFFTPDSPQGENTGTNVWEEDYAQLRLFDPRWYPTAIVLSNGSLLAMGGESGSDAPMVPSAEVLPHPPGVTESTYLDYLARAEAIGRTNSYPHMAILPSGGIFFAQFNESRILSQADFHSMQKLPDMPGSPVNPLTGRNYPLQGTMMLMPQKAPYTDLLEIVLCGGTTHEPGNDALDNCVSIQPDKPGAEWAIERMPSKRVMPTMVGLPDGRYVICNGAHVGRGGFGLADDPNLNAVMYDPTKPLGSRMTVLANTTIARLYHSEGVLLSDGKVLISGSDPQDNGKHPQEKRLEYFYPDYLLSGATPPTFTIEDRDWEYDEAYEFEITSTLAEGFANMRVSLIASIGSTHGITMGQRTLFPEVSCSGNTCTVVAPPNAFVSPPSWYQMFVLDGPTPSHAIWVRIGGDPAGLGNWPQLPGFTAPGV